ncbi:MAG: hypothetical protein ACOX7D_02785 [Alphaproteobacteria bacterium]|jgi:uncharacterized protein with von Willebrand factor type A (vWA) domain|nr:hypothetical protein [Alphaproteobacteria bacterium]
MSEIINKILKELDELEAAADNLADIKSKSDMEISVLSRQLADISTKNIRATQLIDKSISTLKSIK